MWAKGLLLDSDRFARTGAAAVTDPTVADSLATWVAGETTELVVSSIDVELPRALQPFAPHVTAAIEQAVAEQISGILTDDTTHDAVEAALAQAHARVIQAARSPDESVTVNLLPLVRVALDRVQASGLLPDSIDLPQLPKGDPAGQVAALEQAFGRDLDDDLGQFTIYDGDEVSDVGGVLSAVAQIIKLVERATAAILAATVLLFGTTILVATRRRRAFIGLLVGAAIAMFVGSLAIDAVRERIPDLLHPEGREAAVSVFDHFIGGLLDFTRVVALLLAVIGSLAFATRSRFGSIATWRDHPDQVRAGAVFASLAALVAFGFSTTAVVLIVVVWIGVIALRAAGPVVETTRRL